MRPATSMARWWSRMAARICVRRGPKICCNGPTRSGNSNARCGAKTEWRAVAACLPKSAFPGYGSGPSDAGPSSSHNDKGTRPHHGFSAAVGTIDDGECVAVRSGKLRAGAEHAAAEHAAEGRQKCRGETCRCQAGCGEAPAIDDGRDRAYPDRTVRHLGCLCRDAERQARLLCAGEANRLEDQSAESPARSRLRVRFHAAV